MSILTKIKKTISMKTRMLLIPFSIFIISSISSFSQPVWVPTTPSIGSAGPLSIPLNYGIDRAGTVYVTVVNFDFSPTPTAAQIKTGAITGPAGARIATAVLPVNGLNVNNILSTVLYVVNTSRLHSVFITAEDAGGLFVTPVKLFATTLPCPAVDILTGFSQTGVCINNGIFATFQVAMPDPLSTSGILKGTRWSISWGDGSKDTTWISPADYTSPPLALRQHVYTSVSNCNYVFSSTIRNPCGETQSVQYVAVVHGRDIPSDGNGILRIVNNDGGSSVIQICEGVEKKIIIRDNSTWNCQNPLLPGGISAIPNTDQRNIEWLYGLDPDNNTQNTINGTVTIAGGLGNAPATSGRMVPVPYNSSSLSQEITIPATARAGEFFRVYLKNWNKCNPNNADFVSTYIDIEVVAAPDPPTVQSMIYCLADAKTLTVTSSPVGEIVWYNSSMVQVGTGLTYTPTINTTGTFTFYATDRDLAGLLCESVPTAVTITVNPRPATPTITYPNKNDICYGVEPPESYVITASAGNVPPRTGFQWFRDGVLLPGRTSDTIIIKKPHETGSYTVSSVGVAPSYCLSDQSASRYVTVHTLLNVTQPVDQVICQGGTAVFQALTTEAIDSWQWEWSNNGGVSFSTVGNSAPYSGFNTNTLTLTNPGMVYTNYWYRVEMKTPNGQGGCRFKSQAARLTIDQVPTANAGPLISVCRPVGIDPIYMTGATRGGSAASIVWSGGEAMGTWTQHATDPALAFYTPNAGQISGSFTATLTVTGTAACGSIIITRTRTVTWAQTPSVEAGPNISRCDLTPLAIITMDGSSVGGTYSGFAWTGGAGFGTWTQNAINPALAIFTPSTTSGSFTATLSVTGTGACNGTNRTDTRTVAWGQTPAAVAGPDITRCDGTPLAAIFMAGASASGTFTNLTWSGGGGLGNWTQNADPALARFTPTSASGSFVATLSLTGTAGCAGQNVSVTRTISWSHAAIVNAGPDQSICATLSATLAGSFGGGATTASWVGGTGTFNPDRNTLNATYLPSAAETAAKTVTLTLTTNDPSGNCPAVSDDMTIAIGTLPTAAVLVSSGDGCTGTASWLSIGITGGAPPYTFRYRLNGGPIQTVNNYQSGINHNLGNLPAGVYTYAITEIRDFCNNLLPGASLPAPVSFQIYQNPVANAGSDKGVCVVLDAPLTAIPSVGTGAWSQVSGPGVITFNPNVNSTAVVATASVAGTYVIRWTETNVICSSFSDITVSYERAADAGPNQNICGSLTTTLQGNVPAAGTGTWSRISGPGTVTFLPNANTPNATATVSQFGTYVLEWRINNGVFCSSTDDVTFVYEVGADAGPDQHLCNTLTATLAGNAPVSGTGTWSLVSGPGSAIFGPDDHTPGASVTVTNYGTYVFNWRINNGVFCSSNQDVSVTFNPAGQMNQPLSQVLCHNTATADIIFTSGNGSTYFTWTNSAPGIGIAATGSGNILSFTAQNLTTAPVVASIVVTPHFTDGVVNCPGPTRTFTITVNPAAQVNQPSNLFICAGSASGAINFATLNNPGTTSYSWSNDNNTIGLGDSGTGNIPSFTAVNSGIIPVTATITVTPLYNNGLVDCSGPSKTFTITVNPAGQINVLNDIALCHNQAASVTFTTNNSNGTTTYNWTNNNTAIGLAASGSGNSIAFTATNAGTSPITGTVVVTPVFSNGGTSCPGTAETFIITVNPTAQVNQPVNYTFCNGSTGTINFTTVNTVGSSSYSWSNDNADIGLALNGGGNISFTATNTGIAPILANITVTPSFNYAGKDCPGPSKSFTITINPTPQLTSSLTPADVCSNSPFIYTPASATSGTLFTWSRAVVAGITPTGPTNGNGGINETLRNTTNTTIAVTYRYTLSAGGCSITQDVVVEINPEPVIEAGQTLDLCSGYTTNHYIRLVNYTNPGDGVTFTWDAPVLDPVDARFTGGAARNSASSVNIQDAFLNTTGADGTATYTVTPYKDGCAGEPETIVMTIRSQPVLSPILDRTVCSSTSIGLNLSVAPGSVFADYYLVLSRTMDLGLSANPLNAVINPLTSVPAGYLASDKFQNLTGVPKNVTYRVRPVHAPDCFGTPVDIVITINPEPYIVPAQAKTICSGIAIGKEILLLPANIPAGTVFNWAAPTMSDGSGQGSAGSNILADPAGKLHINDVINNHSPAPITATYYITATSTLNCSSQSIPVVITINPEPLPKPIAGRTKICINEQNLIYEVTPTVGSTFHWTVDPAIGTKTFDFNTNAIILNAAAAPGTGNISVYETNSYTCNGDPFIQSVRVYPQSVPENITGSTSVCAGSTNPYTVTARAGSVYSWTIPGGSAVIGDPSSASISVRFGNVGGQVTCRETNEAGCVTIHNPVTVVVRPLPNAILSGGGTVCPGSTVNLFVDFTGTGPYTFVYAINGVAQAPVSTNIDPFTLSVNQAGTYTIISVTDATTCSNTGLGSALVTFHPQSAGIISGGATMCGGATTTLTMTFTGTGPYTFTYTDGTTTYTVPNWGANVYTVSVNPASTRTYTLASLTDGNSCSGTLSGSATVTINIPPALNLTGTNLTCNGDNSGAVTLSVAGSSPFGFAWTGPMGFVSNTQNITGLRAGAYTVTVTDTESCVSTGSITLTEPGAIDATVAITNVLCFGSPEGTITISAPSGGSGNYEYTVNGGTNWVASGIFTGLPAGTYDVRIRDVASPSCNKILNAALVISSPSQLNATVTETDITCYDAANGSIVITNPTGGFGTYNYSINNGGTWQGSGNFPNLTPNTYIVLIRDAAVPSCVRNLGTYIITQPGQLTATVSSANATCFGASDGSITITLPGGGSGAYQYSINGGGSWQASGNYSNLSPGSYNVQIRDAATPSCYRILNNSLTIIQPAVLRATVTSSLISCNGAGDGSINITAPSGGSGFYQYTIDGTNWVGSGLFSNLDPGSYDVRIRDVSNTGCEIVLNGGLDITEPPALNGTVVKYNITCFGAGDGTITITNSVGGYGTYEYSISGAGGPYQALNTFTGLGAGTYSVWMRDRIRTTCTQFLESVVVVEPAVLDADIASTNITCFNANNGTITITNPVGGFGTYQYTINGGGTWVGTGTFLNLSQGSYDVRIRDGASPSCELVLNNLLVITEPTALFATASKTNVTCFGASDGSITISGFTGGYGSYEYTVDGGATWQASNSFLGLLPGYYNVRMRDALNPSCIYTINASLNIAGPAVLNASVTRTNVTCFGADNGTIIVSGQTGGYGTYQFSIDAGATWSNSGTFSNLEPDTYNVQIRDAANNTCVAILNSNVIITEPPALSATLASYNITCNGAGDGRIIISGAAGGYGTYEYTINGGALWSGSGNFQNLSSGTYDVRIRDAANPLCFLTLNNALTITEPAALNAVLSRTNITCFGAGNGTITIATPTGGYGSYEYTINGGGSWQNTGSYTNLGPGNYNVQIRDAANPTCIRVLNNALSIIQLPAVSAVLTPTMITCNGASDGIINITAPSGGSGNYQYTIDGGSNWQATGLFTALTPGIYDVRVRDAVNTVCETILNGSLSITEPSVITATYASGNITCFGANNGSITISAPTGGYGTYDYTIDGTNWFPTGTFTNLTPETYSVQIRDRACPGCVRVLDPALDIIEPAALGGTVNHTDVTCYSANNGTITISGATGGYGTYQYSINGGVNWMSAGNFTGLAPGSYPVRIRDGVNITCSANLGTVVITQPDALSATVTPSNVTCNGANDGSIVITGPFGGYGTYQYSINGGTSWQASGNFPALSPGFYNVLMRDAAQPACIIVLNGSLTITQPGVLGGTVTKNDITCNGTADGRITITSPTGGYGTHEYSIHGGAAGTWQSSGTFNGLAAATYDVWIRDAAHPACIAVLSAGLVISEPDVLDGTLLSTDVTCNGANDGTITITNTTGGYGSYQYTINGTNWFGIGSFTNLAPATYTILIRDAANPACVINLGDIEITQPPVLNANVASINVTCAGGSDGSIIISAPTGGYGNYEYSINGGGSWHSSGSFTGLVPGSYNVRMRDADHTNCVRVLNNALNITQLPMMSALVTATMVTCNNANDGIINITNPLGGSGTYQYTVNGGANWFNSGSFTGLAPGTYDVQIRDAVTTGCVIVLNSSLIITEPAVLDANLSSNNVTCFGANNGTISVTSPTGGYGTFEYSRDGATWQATGQFTGLAPGPYNIRIRDRAHPLCVITLPAVTITEPAVLSATVSRTNVTCNGANDGTITISNPLGGYGTYGYSSNGGVTWQPTGTFTNLAPNTYDLRIRDAANPACIITLASVTITQPAALSASVTSTNVTCNGANDGTITISGAAGGYSSYQYSINGTDWYGTGNFTSLAPGFYNVQIRDLAYPNCVRVINSSLRISEPGMLGATVTKNDITCNGADDGKITVSLPTGGYGTYEYSIYGGAAGTWQGSLSFTGLTPGNYDVWMRDAAHTGCTAVLSAGLIINEPALLTATIAGTNITCNGANDGTITVTDAAGGYGSYQYSINGTNWFGSGLFANLAPDIYTVLIRDAANQACVINLGSVSITQQPALNATLASTNATCAGGGDGTITITFPTGGYGNYEYSINGGGSWEATGVYTGLVPGSYSVRMRDKDHINCVRILNNALSITQPVMLSGVVTATMVTCNGANDGIINITNPLGGTGSYEYSINGGVAGSWQGSGTFNGLVPGTYNVQIRDQVHPACVIVLNASLIITEPAVLNASLSSTNVTCFGANNGTISVTSPTGGYGTFEYSRDGVTWQATGIFGSLAPATYNIQIRDRAHPLCFVTLPAVVITEPDVLSASVAFTNVTCKSANNGTITIFNPLGGYGTYGYSVNGGTSWQPMGNFTNLAPATYNLRIRDAANPACVIALSPVTITEPDAITAIVTSTDVTCNGEGNGTITITDPLGGYGTYDYSIDGGSNWQATGNFTALAPGFYNVQVRDRVHTNCIKVLNSSLMISQPGILGATVVKNDITCFGVNDGKITIISPSGGYGTYEYSINGGAVGSWQASGSFAALPPATYNVQMRDAAHTGCVAILNAALVINEPAVLSASLASTNVTCNGANDGTISITLAAGGYGSYQYSIGGVWSGSGLFTGLAPAIYTVQMRDAVNQACIVTIGTINITQQAVLNATLTSVNVTCAGGGDGSITISAPTGGYGNYEYSINGGGSWEATGVYTGLVPGSYSVRMRDKDHINCVRILNNALSITQPVMLSGVVTATMVTCNGANDGIINITNPLGGTGSYEYSINGGVAGSWQGSGTFNGLVPGTYNVQIRDQVHPACVIVLNASLIITEPAVLNASLSSTNVTCFGANNGTISVTSPTGGYGTFEYSRDGVTWQATGIFGSLAPATYNIQIRDRAHPLCFVTLPAVVITEPDVLSATVASTNVTCKGTSNGTITISDPLGGYGTYGYSVNGGASWQPSGSFTNLAPNTYDIRIRDAVNIACVTILPAVTITEPDGLSATVESTNVTCNGASDGTITITNPLGGYGTFDYSINGGINWQATGVFAGLAPGFYNVQIRDRAHQACVITLNSSLRITEPSVLTATITKTNVTCFNAANGTITILGPSGGYGTYEYSISGGASWQSANTFSGLTPANYNVQIRDAAYPGCVIVLDASFEITQPLLLSATVTPRMVSCNAAADGMITITSPTGGYGIYQYSINGGLSWQGSGTFMGLAPASYNVMIRDASYQACTITLNPSLNITQPGILSANITGTNTTCFGGSDGIITLSSPSGGYGTYEYSINGGGSWQASGTFAALSPGSYSVLIRDAVKTNCMRVLNNAFVITQPGLLSASVSKTDISCNGSNNGIINVTSPLGGSGNYEYSINGGSSWSASGSFTNLLPAAYDVRIRDAASTACSVILYPNLIIAEPLSLVITTTGNVSLDCFDDKGGMGTFFGTGGTLPYTFTVISNTAGATIPAPGFNSQAFYNAGSGSVTVSVTDSRGCTSQATIILTQPSLLTAGSIGQSQVVCNGQNPAQLTETAPATGGPGTYNYQWQYSLTSAGPFINIADATASQYTPSAGATSTLYYRRMVTSGMCSPVYSNVVEVLVNPLPLATITGGETICPGQNSILKVNLPLGMSPFEIDIENYPGLTITGYASGTDIIVSPGATTTYRLLRVRDANGCTVTSPTTNLTGQATVTVRALPAITTSPVSKVTCEFGMVTFNVAATGSDLTYQWYVDQGAGFTPLTDAGVYIGSATSTLSIFGATRNMNGFVYHAAVTGCSVSVTSANAVLTVNTFPEIQLQPVDSTTCVNAGAAFGVVAIGTNVGYQWQVNKGAGFVNITDDLNVTGSGTDTLTIASAPATFNNNIFRVMMIGTCGAPVYSNFAVLRLQIPPTVTLNPVSREICEGGGPVAFTASGTGQIDSLRWQVNSGSGWSYIYDNSYYGGTTSQQLTVTGIPPSFNGNRYRLALKAKCTIVYSNEATLTVNGNPVVDFSLADTLNACGGIPIVLEGNPSGGSGIYSNHLWTGDVGPLDNYFISSPVFNPIAAGTYAVNYRVRDSKGCYGNDDLVVIVDSPSADFIKSIQSGCTPLNVSFVKDTAGLAKFWWDFKDGSPFDSINPNPVHTFVNTNRAFIKYFDVTLTVRSPGGCTDQYTSAVMLYPEIDATFTVSTDTICSGSSIEFLSAPGANKYFWDYGDGDSGYSMTESSSHLYLNFSTVPVTRTVTLRTTSFYNCEDVKTMNIVVMPVPVPQFTAVPVVQIYDPAGNAVTFTNQTNTGNWTYLWKFGDGISSVDRDPVHTYLNIGEYTVTLIVTNASCADSIRRTVSVRPIPPVAAFDSIPPGCSPMIIDLNNTSLHTEAPGTTYYWNFGDGSTSTAKNPNYTYYEGGTYRIELTVTGPGGTSATSRLVTIYPSPQANFNVTPKVVFVNDEPVRMFNLTQGVNSYLWEFGDGDTSTIEEPFHKYIEEGDYDITLHATSNNGCTNTFILSPAVKVEPAGELRFSSVFTPNKDGPIERTDLPTGGIELDQFFFPPVREKVLNYKLQVFNRWGTLIFESRDINKPWNGYYKGELCQQGVYVWYVEGKYATGKPFRKIGDITLLH